MPHLSPMLWYFVSEVLLLGVLIFASLLWWSYSSKVEVKVNFSNTNLLHLPWD